MIVKVLRRGGLVANLCRHPLYGVSRCDASNIFISNFEFPVALLFPTVMSAGQPLRQSTILNALEKMPSTAQSSKKRYITLINGGQSIRCLELPYLR